MLKESRRRKRILTLRCQVLHKAQLTDVRVWTPRRKLCRSCYLLSLCLSSGQRCLFEMLKIIGGNSLNLCNSSCPIRPDRRDRPRLRRSAFRDQKRPSGRIRRAWRCDRKLQLDYANRHCRKCKLDIKQHISHNERSPHSSCCHSCFGTGYPGSSPAKNVCRCGI